MNKIFEMKLRPDPFNRICSGEKTIEYRLHDEKRSLLNKGDYIRFTEKADEERTVLVEIVDIFTASGTETPGNGPSCQRFILTGRNV